jgi:hypothetical protein
MKKKNIRTKVINKTRPQIKKSISKNKVARKVISKVTPKVIRKIKKAPVIIKESIVQGKTPTEMNLLEQFFGGSVKLKLWKVFLLNVSKEFTLKDLSRLTKTKYTLLIPNLREMMRQGLIEGNKKLFVTEKQNKESAIFYRVTKDFPLASEITQLILTAIPRSSEKVLSELTSLQRLKTVLLSGFFTSKLGLSTQIFSATQSPVDMLLIFEKVPANVSEIVAELEHKLGRDLRYAALDEVDFKYRHSIGDKLIRDVLDFDHVVAMDKMAFFR